MNRQYEALVMFRGRRRPAQVKSSDCRKRMASDLRLAAGDESFALDVVQLLVVIEQRHIGVAAATA